MRVAVYFKTYLNALFIFLFFLASEDAYGYAIVFGICI